jgi:hypothetical protein
MSRESLSKGNGWFDIRFSYEDIDWHSVVTLGAGSKGRHSHCTNPRGKRKN